MRLIWITLQVVLFSIIGIQNIFAEATSDEMRHIEEFVANFDLPKLQKISVIIDIPEHDVKVFTIKYGEAQDCPAGCLYSAATGILYDGRIVLYFNKISSSR